MDHKLIVMNESETHVEIGKVNNGKPNGFGDSAQDFAIVSRNAHTWKHRPAIRLRGPGA